MDLRTGLRLLHERWKAIVAVTLLAAIAGGLYTWRQTPLYSAQATLFVSTWNNAETSSSAYQGGLASVQRVRSYTELLRGDRVLSAVRDQLALQAGTDQLAAKIGAAVVPDTALLTLTVTDANPLMAQLLANTVASEFVELVPVLEGARPGETPPVRVSVVSPAVLPAVPVSPRPTRNMGLSLLIGLFAGVVLALARHTLDSTVKSAEQVAQLAAAPSLGTVPVDRDAGKHPLVSGEDPYSLRAEAFRKIRTNMRFVNVDRVHKTIVVTSALAGEGKSTTACNIALAATETGQRVLLVDADLRRPRAAGYLGMPSGVGLTSVLVNAASLDEAIQTRAGEGLLDVLATGPIPPNPTELLASRHMSDVLTGLRERYDLIVIDAAPVLPVADAAVTAAYCDGTILVTRYGKARHEHVHAMVAALRAVDARILGTVLNCVPVRGGNAYYEEYAPVPTTGREGPRAMARRLVGSSTRQEAHR